MKNSKGTPSKETGAKSNTSNNDVDFRNCSTKSNASQSGTSNKASGKGTK